jgi:Putative zinc-finger/Predicted integral membrane protein (DUF2275)
MMEHDDIRHKLSDYIDGSVSAGERAEIKAHLETCTSCSNAFRELRITIEHIKTIEEMEPPAWITQKIMAKVRSAEAPKKSLFHRLFIPVQIKIPLQVVALLLAMGAFHIYHSIEPSSKVAESTSGRFSAEQRASAPSARSPGSPPSDQAWNDLRKKENSFYREQQFPQAPAYKSLDMKFEYAPPAPPVRKDAGKAPASDQTKRADRPASAGETIFTEKSAAGQAPPPARGTARQGEPNQRALAQAGKAAEEETVFDESTSGGEETEAEVVKKLHDYFINHDLPRSMKDRKYTMSKIQEIPANMQWIDLDVRNKLASCKNGYLIDVEPSGKTLRCVYCADNDSVRLFGKYTHRNDRWIKVE